MKKLGNFLSTPNRFIQPLGNINVPRGSNSIRILDTNFVAFRRPSTTPCIGNNNVRGMTTVGIVEKFSLFASGKGQRPISIFLYFRPSNEIYVNGIFISFSHGQLTISVILVAQRVVWFRWSCRSCESQIRVHVVCWTENASGWSRCSTFIHRDPIWNLGSVKRLQWIGVLFRNSNTSLPLSNKRSFEPTIQPWLVVLKSYCAKLRFLWSTITPAAYIVSLSYEVFQRLRTSW